VAQRGGHALFAARTAGRATLVFAAAAPPASMDAGRLLKATLVEFGGKGGGSATMAQGGLADPARAAEALAWAVRASGSASSP